jgi:hypothetical protein
MQPPDPHCGSPHPPPGGASYTGNDPPAALWAAGTLRRFSTFFVPQLGQAGVSRDVRMSSSNSLSHFWQVYS